MKRYFFLMPVLIFLVGCDNRSESTKIAHLIISETLSDVRDVYGFDRTGFYEERDKVDREKYKAIGVSFTMHKKISKDDGRFLLLRISKLFMDKINADEDMRLLMADHPITENNIEVTISIHPADDSKLSEFDIYGLYIGSLGVMYTYRIANSEYGLRNEFETVEEAHRLANEMALQAKVHPIEGQEP